MRNINSCLYSLSGWSVYRVKSYSLPVLYVIFKVQWNRFLCCFKLCHNKKTSFSALLRNNSSYDLRDKGYLSAKRVVLSQGFFARLCFYNTPHIASLTCALCNVPTGAAAMLTVHLEHPRLGFKIFFYMNSLLLFRRDLMLPLQQLKYWDWL